MDGERFDAVLRRAVGDGSRRGVLPVGVWTLAAAALGVAGGGAFEDAAAKHKHKKKRKKPSPPPPPTPQQCTADRPVICGDGCCGGSFPQCCTDLIETNGHICAPSSAACCAPVGGGGWCGTGFR